MNLRIIKNGHLRDPLEGPFEICISRDDAEHLIDQLQTAITAGHKFGWLKIEPTPEGYAAAKKVAALAGSIGIKNSGDFLKHPDDAPEKGPGAGR